MTSSDSANASLSQKQSMAKDESEAGPPFDPANVLNNWPDRKAAEKLNDWLKQKLSADPVDTEEPGEALAAAHAGASVEASAVTNMVTTLFAALALIISLTTSWTLSDKGAFGLVLIIATAVATLMTAFLGFLLAAAWERKKRTAMANAVLEYRAAKRSQPTNVTKICQLLTKKKNARSESALRR